jgi:hypothetical protein
MKGSEASTENTQVLLPPICWVHRSAANPVLVREIDEGFDYCPDCVKVVAQEYRDKYPQWAGEIIEDGGYEPLRFSDSPPLCERCQCMLSCSIEVDGELHYIETEGDWCAAP